MALDVSQVVSLLAALGLGSLLTQYVSKGHERRSVRAEVLAALYAVELARRPGHGVFHDAAIEFQTRALIARVPRDTVRHYLAYAETAWMLAEEPDGVQAGRVLATTDVSEQGASFAAAIVTWIVWNPFWSRLIKVAERRDRLDVWTAHMFAKLLDEKNRSDADTRQHNLRSLSLANDCRRKNGLDPLPVKDGHIATST